MMQVFKGKTLGYRQRSRKHNKGLLRLSRGTQEMGWLACLHGVGRKGYWNKIKTSFLVGFLHSLHSWLGRQSRPGLSAFISFPKCCWGEESGRAAAELCGQEVRAWLCSSPREDADVIFKYPLMNSLQFHEHFCLHFKISRIFHTI